MKTVKHENEWWWGKSITIISENAKGMVEVQFDENMPGVGFIKNLSVVEEARRNGIGTALVMQCEDYARIYGKSFVQLTADKNKEWLVEWYKSMGYVITSVDDHEYLMTKAL